MQDVYKDVAEDEAHFRSMQVGRYSHIYSITLNVRNDGDDAAFSNASRKRTATLQIEEDAEFHIQYMTAAVIAPVGVGDSMARDAATPTTFLAAGVTAGRSDRGLAFRMSEPGSGRLLCLGQTRTIGPNQITPDFTSESAWWAKEGYIPLEAVFPAAYGFEFLAPLAFEYYIARNKRLQIEFINRDSDTIVPVGSRSHRVTLTFIGNRYDAY